MMEEWDVLDRHGNQKGYKKKRGEQLLEGEYHKVVHIWILSDDGHYLVQKRSQYKEEFPNIWAATGGSVIAGENSVQGAIREVDEEIGILLTHEELEPIFSYCPQIEGFTGITDVYMVKKNIDITKCIIDKDEVEALEYMPKEDIMKKVNDYVFYNYANENSNYFSKVFNMY